MSLKVLEWLKFQILLPPNAGEDAEQQEFFFIAGSNVK